LLLFETNKKTLKEKYENIYLVISFLF